MDPSNADTGPEEREEARSHERSDEDRQEAMSDETKDTALKITEEIVKLADDITMLHGINREAAFQFAITATLISAIENLRTLFTMLSPDQGTQN